MVETKDKKEINKKIESLEEENKVCLENIQVYEGIIDYLLIILQDYQKRLNDVLKTIQVSINTTIELEQVKSSLIEQNIKTFRK